MPNDREIGAKPVNHYAEQAGLCRTTGGKERSERPLLAVKTRARVVIAVLDAGRSLALRPAPPSFSKKRSGNK
jgi:hypothetical protein